MSASVKLSLEPHDYKTIVMAVRILILVVNYLDRPRNVQGTQPPREFIANLTRQLQTELDPFSHTIDAATLKRHLQTVLQELGAS